MAFFKSRPTKVKQYATKTGAQTQAINQAAQFAGGNLADLYQQLQFDPETFAQRFQTGVAQPAIQQFQEQVAPGIQERFINAGAGRSSAGQRALSTAGERLQSDLAATQANQMQQAQQFSQSAQLQALLQALGISAGASPYENVAIPGQESTVMTLLKAAAGGAGQAAGAGAYRAYGAAAGY